MPLLKTRATIYLATWNTRTMWETGRVFQIAAEMRRYNLEVLGISETQWTQVGQQRLASGKLLLYSSHYEENTPHTQVVALMLSKGAQNALIGWESHGPRIIKASFKTKNEGITLNVIQCYAPTNDYNEDVPALSWSTQWRGNYYGEQLESDKRCNTSTCHEVLGHKKHHHNEWIIVDTLDKIQESRNKTAINTIRTSAEKAKVQAEYTEVNKQVKTSIRTDKRKYVEDLAMTAEKAAREGNMRQLHDITKKLSGNHRKPERPVKSKEGEVITNIEEQRNR
ncbi:unnamed protein product [Schistosoma margrebowiei]|uniref:Uncharacterized protein n=1 Tax=Schistosoma margrebowiei TaxID=48269 RepID=A0A183MSE0_9TREM|nr:unnamed protein product [Schistosoma margrebowiei]